MAEQASKATADETDLAAGAKGVAAEMRAVADDLKDAAVEQGRELYEGARRQATSFADDRKNEAAASVSDIASTLRETGRGFGEGRPAIQAFVDGAADGLEQFAAGLRERSFTEIYGEAEAYARRSPVVVGAVAAAAGFLLARFVKSSTDEMSASAAAMRDRAAVRRSPARGREADD